MKWISDGVSILHCIKTYCKSVVTLISLIYLPLFDYCLCSIMAKIWPELLEEQSGLFVSTTEYATYLE